jgi:guanylate kinase
MAKFSGSPKIIIISAPSGAGKTTIVRQVLKDFPQLEFSISATTRDPRKGEIDGRDYYFLSIQEFRERIDQDEFIEYEEVYEELIYGTLSSEVSRITEKGHCPIFDVDVKGGINIKRQFGDQALSIFIKPPSPEELERRLRGRGTDSEEVIVKRLERAKEELSYTDHFDKLVVNDVLKDAIDETEKIIREFL